MREAQYLQNQARDAKAAMRATAHGLLNDIGSAADPRRWTQSHPWASLATAAIAGFVAVTAAMPRKSDAAERSQPHDPDHKDPSEDESAETDGESHGREGRHFISHGLSVAMKILSVARPILSSLLAAWVAHAQAGQHNGQHPASGAGDPAVPHPDDAGV